MNPNSTGATKAPKLNKVVRLDNLPLNQTYYTEEGYLKDRPILTRTGIFEYVNADGTVSRELRLPEDVFAPESLKSYKGKPIIITHDAGLVTKNNVHQEQIGTILTEGYRSGDDVRAEIIIHDTDEMKSCGLRELSLGYNLDLEPTSGEWNGQPYDAIQRNIRINHLALVQEARAGETTRLNIDSRDKKIISKGGEKMKKTTKKVALKSDGVLSQEEFAKAIEAYKARRAQRLAAKADEEVVEEVVSTKPANGDEEETAPAKTEAPVVEVLDNDAPIEEKVALVKDRRDRRDSDGDPATKEEAMGVIAKQDEDIEVLFDIIDTLFAEKEFDSAEVVETKPIEEETKTAEKADNEEVIEEEAVKTGALDEEEEKTEVVAPTVDNEEILADPKAMNADSVDAIVRQRVQLGMIGNLLNMDGLENMRLRDAKKAVILAVKPGLRLDGKSNAYINAAYDCAVADIKSRSKKTTSYQKQQMFNKKVNADGKDTDSAFSARERMINRQYNKEVK